MRLALLEVSDDDVTYDSSLYKCQQCRITSLLCENIGKLWNETSARFFLEAYELVRLHATTLLLWLEETGVGLGWLPSSPPCIACSVRCEMGKMKNSVSWYRMAWESLSPLMRRIEQRARGVSRRSEWLNVEAGKTIEEKKVRLSFQVRCICKTVSHVRSRTAVSRWMFPQKTGALA